ncbi:MAG: FGGY-family carbohydrate kinase [Clostridia bacterium]|nr:FGGY-family carbohydrate kinase [Clostridia bacterium]
MTIAGIDIGTSGSKIAVYDDKGTVLFRNFMDYPHERDQSQHEVNPRAIWDCARDLIKSAAQALGGLDAIGISSFGESFIMLDEGDEPIANAILYTDPRGIEQAARLSRILTPERIADISGVTPHSMYSLPKLMWVKENRPQVYNKIRRVLLIEDYVVYMLTGIAQIDYSLATRTMALDINKKEWSGEIFDAAGIDASLMSKPVATGTVAGKVKRSLAGQLGLGENTLVVNCCHDQVAAAVGAGVFESGIAVDGAGSTECITPVFAYPEDKSGFITGNYAIVPYVVPERYVCYAFLFTGGALVSWFTKRLAGYADSEAQKRRVPIYQVLEEGMRDEPTGILALPHFAGAGTPHMDEGAKGAYVGLSVDTTLSDMYKATLEGVAYEMRLNMKMLESAGMRIDRLHATGGGAKSSKWLQIKADILGREIVSLGDSEAGIIGGIMLTAVAVGAFSDYKQAAGVYIKEQGIYKPNPATSKKYDAYFERYEKLYDSVRPLV